MIRSAALSVFSPWSRSGGEGGDGGGSHAETLRRRVNRVCGILEGEAARYGVVDDAGSDFRIEAVEVDVEVDLLHASAQLVQRGQHVSLWLRAAPLHRLDGRSL